MRVVHRGGGGVRVVEIDIDDPDATVGDLVAALDPGAIDRAGGLTIEPVIDGAPATADSPLSGVALCEGSVVDTTGEPAATRAPVRTLAVIGGVRAGVVVDATHSLTVGRADRSDLRIADPALSHRHFEICSGSVRDLGSRNGSAIEGHPLLGPAPVAEGAVIRAGTTRFRIGAHVDDVPVAVAQGLGARGGAIPFNRPPRRAPTATAPTLTCPGPGPLPPSREPLSIAGIVLPVLAGAVVALLFSPFMAVFAALGPVLTVGTWWERRRRARKEHRQATAVFVGAVAEMAERLPAGREEEIRRRRELHPDPAEVVRRAEGPSVRLWERRVGHADAFLAAIGVTDERWHPVLVPTEGELVAEEALALVESLPVMPDVPIPVDLSAGHVVGLVGDREASMAVARSLLVQMATHHGPADLCIAVGADVPAAWWWTTWLPHTADHAGGRRGAGLMTTHDSLGAAALLAGVGERTILAVLDGDDPFQGRGTVGRHLLTSEETSAIVLVRDEHRLPARCDLVARIDSLGRLTVLDPRRADAGRCGLGWGIGTDVATSAARRMARLDDPELPLVGTGVPGGAPLLGLLGISGTDASLIESRWSQTDGTADLVTPIGADGDGPLLLDLVADGPHLLIGGTTGSGKSELLRSLVAGVAASADPDHVAMVLIDYKGGAAFDCCASLPHVAGLVTDLDSALAGRALRCLEAELRYREHRLREVGADDMASFRAASGGSPGNEPLPRLLVVVDEFASLAAELPDFVEALVGVAQRGRSLGVHMVLATQRPAGAVTDDIRANAGCRVALRVTDRNDSIDVIDSPDAAAIPRSRPGRAVARFGPGELVPFQAAHVTGRSSESTGVRVQGVASSDEGRAEVETDLQRLVGIVNEAHRGRGGRRPRSPWPPQLPDDLRRGDQDPAIWLLVDEPDRQRQRFDGWSPSTGHLVVVGAPRAGATSTLVAAALAATADPETRCTHLHVIDLDAGGLAPLARLPAAGTIVGPSDRVRRVRLLRWLAEEVDRRRTAPSIREPALLVLVDDLGGLARAHDVVREPLIHEWFARVWADGPAVGVTIATSLRRAADLAPGLLATAGTVLLHRTADPSDGLRLGVKTSTEEFPPGRAVRVRDAVMVQVMRDGHTIAAAVESRLPASPLSPPPHEVGELRSEITWPDAEPAVDISPRGAQLRIAVADRDLTSAVLHLHPGEHALVLGPARSGRTTALVTLARAAGDAAVVVGDELGRRSGIEPIDPETILATVADRGPTLVLVDDALQFDDPRGELRRLVASPPAGLHVVASARPDRYRAAYGHWAAEIKASRAGLLLRPDPLDGDLLGHPLPGRLDIPPLPGRGLLVGDGSVEVVQVVLPEGQSTS
jgi:S-DNA-T family DNA segregation ATPase FtsK/SpoIIIE